MQVALAVRAGEAPVEGTMEGGLAGSWSAMGKAFRWFSVATLCITGFLGAILLFMFYSMLLWDIGVRVKESLNRKKKGNTSQR